MNETEKKRIFESTSPMHREDAPFFFSERPKSMCFFFNESYERSVP